MSAGEEGKQLAPYFLSPELSLLELDWGFEAASLEASADVFESPAGPVGFEPLSLPLPLPLEPLDGFLA